MREILVLQDKEITIVGKYRRAACKSKEIASPLRRLSTFSSTYYDITDITDITAIWTQRTLAQNWTARKHGKV